MASVRQGHDSGHEAEVVLLETPTSALTLRRFNDAALLARCVADVRGALLETPEIIVFGRVCHQRRNVGFFSDTSAGYPYSGRVMLATPCTGALRALLSAVNVAYGAAFNGILVNQYRSGADYISAHSDDEKTLDPAGVVSVSVGATRRFVIRTRATKAVVLDHEHVAGTMLRMRGAFQKEFTHEIPATRAAVGERMSFTFRKHH
jgi:alkylated DNA repair dioxygenase AlkB